MSRVAKRRTFTVLGGLALLALIYLTVPVHALVETETTPDVLCSKSTRDGVVLAECEEPGWLVQWSRNEVQTHFRDPLY